MSKMSDYYADGFEAPEGSNEDEFGLIPTEWYPVEIAKVEIKDTKEGTGARFITEYTIIGEKYANRKVWSSFNFINASQEAQAIGQRELGRLTKACGYGENERLHDEDELLGKQLDIYVETEAGTGGYKDRNIASKFRTLGSGGQAVPMAPVAPTQVAETVTQSPETVTQAPAAKAAPAPAGAGKRPWEK